MISTTTLAHLITSSIQTYLVDAYGVLYDSSGVFSGTHQAVEHINQQNNLYVVTNNTTLSTKDISKRLCNSGLNIPEQHVFSSGLGLQYDPKIRSHFEEKRVYVYGRDSSLAYIQPTNAIISPTLDQIDTIALLAYDPNSHQKEYHKIKTYLLDNPNTTVVCANPDQYVVTDQEYYPVIGYYATQLQEETGCTIHWIGKPYQNFSIVLQTLLKNHHQINLDQATCFFDDNPENVSEISQKLNILGCCVLETGLASKMTLEDIQSYTHIHYAIPRFAL